MVMQCSVMQCIVEGADYKAFRLLLLLLLS